MKKTLITLLTTLSFIPLSGIGYGNYGKNCWCNDGTQIYVDALYFRPDGEELNFLYTRTESAVGGDTVISNENHTIDPDWSPGVRVGMETGFGCPDLNIFATWTWYETNGNKRVDLALGDDDSLIVQSDFLTTEDVMSTAQVTADFYFMFNRLDLGISKPCCICENVNFKPFGAFTYLHVNQNLAIDALFENATQESHNKIEFCGYGATIGSELDWNFACNLSLYGLSSVTGVWGEYSTEQNFISSDVGVTEETRSRMQFGEWRGRLLTRLQLGLKACTTLCGCYNVYGVVGWEYLHMFNQTDWMVKVSHEIDNVNKPAADLALQGLFVKFAFTF